MKPSAPKIVQVVPYDPNWPGMFEVESLNLQNVLGNNCIAIHHIGSTSVPELPAKPIIDIIVIVKNILDVDLCNVNSGLKRS